jgi:hypothetical protein
MAGSSAGRLFRYVRPFLFHLRSGFDWAVKIIK